MDDISLPELQRRLDGEGIRVSGRTLINGAGSGVIRQHRLEQSPAMNRPPQHWFSEDTVRWYADEVRYWKRGYKDALPLWPQGHGGPKLWPTRRVARALDYGKTQAIEVMKGLGVERRGDKLYVDRAALERQWQRAVEDLEGKIHGSEEAPDIVAWEYRDGAVGASTAPLVLGPIELKPTSGRRFIPRGAP